MGVVLPIAVLSVLGWLWLWERGYTLVWVFLTLGLTGLSLLTTFLVVRWLERQHAPIDREADDAGGGADGMVYSPREEEAWRVVNDIAEAADPKQLTNKDQILALGVRTIEAVATKLHPDTSDAIWRFTVPEALALIEQVAQRLRPMIVENVPLGDQLSVGQVIKIYRWRSAIDIANRAYDLWRIVRLMNPVAAATQEMRERMTKSMYASVREELAKRLARAYVQEVGRAAIDLYGGRLKIDTKQLASHISQQTRDDQAKAAQSAEPIRVLVAGQRGAGKSSLINALGAETSVAADIVAGSEEFVPVRLSLDGLAELIFVDAPAIEDDAAALDRLASNAGAADLLIWVVAANRADRLLDIAGLAAIDTFFAGRADLRRPPRIVVASHIDRLRPIQDWTPPYDLTDAENPKVQSITSALASIVEDLGLAPEDITPVCLADPPGTYNVDVVWASISTHLDDAKRAQLVRLMSEIRKDGTDWRRVMGQAAGAGRLLAKALKSQFLKR